MPKTKKVSPDGEIWKPAKIGDKLVGTLETIRKTSGKFGPQTAMDFTTAEGKKTVFCDTVLKRYADVMEKGKTYMLIFDGWGQAMAKARSEKNNYRNWMVEEVLS
jgi:hypothetical protein